MSDKNNESFEEYWGQNTSGQYGRIERVIAKNAWVCCEKLHAEKLQAAESDVASLKKAYDETFSQLTKIQEKLRAAEEKLNDYDKKWRERYLVNNPFEEYYRGLEKENRILREAVEYALSQKEQEYGMESVYDIHQFRQRKVFSILEEALEK